MFILTHLVHRPIGHSEGRYLLWARHLLHLCYKSLHSKHTRLGNKGRYFRVRPCLAKKCIQPEDCPSQSNRQSFLRTDGSAVKRGAASSSRPNLVCRPLCRLLVAGSCSVAACVRECVCVVVVANSAPLSQAATSRRVSPRLFSAEARPPSAL